LEKRAKLLKLSGLYPLSDPSLISYSELPFALELMFHNGVTVFQFRDKSKDKSHALEVCKHIRTICDEYDALFIIDDDVEFALIIGADGVHIGKDDMDIEEARAILGIDKIIGVSCYGDIDRAIIMQRRGADYVAFGSCYPSITKPNAAVVNKSVLMNAKELLDIPICAIGGIDSNNVVELIGAGADMVAVISDIWNAQNLSERVEEYRKILNDK
jgi:thiamine-phosphate pyrophosphorylase